MTKRKKLKAIMGQRTTFTGVFAGTGTKRGWQGREDETILLQDITLSGTSEVVTEHLWFNYTKGFKKLGQLKIGTVIQFDARVTVYYKGYMGYRLDVYKPVEKDYKLERPTKIRRSEL